MKKLLSLLMVSTILGSVAYTPKSQAGIALIASPVMAAPILGMKPLHAALLPAVGVIWKDPAGIAFFSAQVLGVGGLVAGPILMATGNIIPGIVVVVLDENGSVSQGQLESTLSERYSFIADREIISSMATKIKSKAETMEFDAKGLKMVSLSQEEVESILAPADLTAEEVVSVVQDLK